MLLHLGSFITFRPSTIDLIGQLSRSVIGRPSVTP